MDLEFLRPEIHTEETSLLAHRDEGELAVDVYETAQAVFVKTAIAGIQPQDISISLNHDLLTIRGARHDEGMPEERSYLCRECHWGAFSRTIILPAEVSPAKAQAIFKGGILVIKLPKAKKREEIRVKVEE